MATTDAGSGSSHQYRITSGSSTTPTIPTKTYAEIQTMGMMVNGAWVRKLRYGDGITFGCFLVSLFSSSLLLYGSRPGTNGVGMGFYHLPLEVEFPRALDQPKGRY